LAECWARFPTAGSAQCRVPPRWRRRARADAMWRAKPCLVAAVLASVLGLAASPAFSLAGAAPRRPVTKAKAGGASALPLLLEAPSGANAGQATQGRVAGLTAAGLLACWALSASRTRRVDPVPATAQWGSERRGGVGRCAPSAVALRALPEAGDLASQAMELWRSSGGDPAAFEGAARAFQHWAEAHAAGLSLPEFHFGAPAFADTAVADPAAAVSAAVDPAAVVLDPNTKYVFGVDGKVLIDPMSNKPITDDWWNGFIGFQCEIIKALDGKLREAGVKEAFGWTIVLYTVIVKVLFYPLQQSQLRSTSMMQLLSPKVKEIQERYKDDPDSMNRMLGQLYTVMDVNPLGGCLPVFIQLPLFWSLYGVWRRLSAEQFPHYAEPWLWVPSLAQPNPDFQFKFDWLREFENGAPKMGWHDYLCYLVFPAILVGFTVVSQQQAQAQKPKGEEAESQQLLLQVLPWISVYFIGSLSLELPQAVSVYYTANTGLQLAQTAFVKEMLRNEIPGYRDFEKTGKFPESAFDDLVKTQAPPPKTLHEAALRGDEDALEKLLDSEGEVAFDLNAWDEKEIAPLGYAVACGHVKVVRSLIKRGANLQIRDGQDNSLLHYAAGYGHKECLEEIIQAAASQNIWHEQEWKDWRNKKGQSVMDAARVNRKGQVMDYLSEILGIPQPSLAPPAAPAAPAVQEAEVVAESTPSAESLSARAALLAAAGNASGAEGAAASGPAIDAPAAPVAGAQADEAAAAMRTAVAKLKENPEAVEQARKMMGKMPPQLLSMLSGNKLSAEQAQKAMEAMQDMSTDEILSQANVAAERLAPVGAAQPEAKVPVMPARSSNEAARAVD